MRQRLHLIAAACVAVVYLLLLVQASSAQPAPAPSPSPDNSIGIHPILGVQIDTNAILARGLLVDAIMPNSIAQRMGLQPGDILLKLNGVELAKMDVLRQILSGLKRGDKLVVQYKHGSQTLEKKDNLNDVPTLPSYELVEGKGVPGVVEIGFTRDQMEKALGKPLGEIQRDGQTFLAYPFHGLAVGLLDAGGAMRVVQFTLEYPFVCRTRRGVAIGDPVSAVEAAYRGEVADTRVVSERETVVLLPRLGLRFRCLDGKVAKIVVIPIEAAPAPTGSP